MAMIAHCGKVSLSEEYPFKIKIQHLTFLISPNQREPENPKPFGPVFQGEKRLTEFTTGMVNPRV